MNVASSAPGPLSGTWRSHSAVASVSPDSSWASQSSRMLAGMASSSSSVAFSGSPPPRLPASPPPPPPPSPSPPTSRTTTTTAATKARPTSTSGRTGTRDRLAGAGTRPGGGVARPAGEGPGREGASPGPPAAASGLAVGWEDRRAVAADPEGASPDPLAVAPARAGAWRTPGRGRGRLLGRAPPATTGRPGRAGRRGRRWGDARGGTRGGRAGRGCGRRPGGSVAPWGRRAASAAPANSPHVAAVLGLLGQGSPDDRADLLRKLGVLLARRRRLPRHVGGDDGLEVAGEGRVAGEALVQNAAGAYWSACPSTGSLPSCSGAA